MIHRAAAPVEEASPTLTERLNLMFEWYRGMVSEQTGRLVYTYDPETDRVIADGSPIRDIASLWDLELLSRFLGRSDLLPVVARGLTYYAGFLVSRDGGLILDPERLGEPSGIAHSAFLILALCESDLPGREAMIAGLAEGILGQQREDGSYRIHFGPEYDEGLELYPGEAMLALMRAYALGKDAKYLRSVERGFEYQRERFPPDALPADIRVFHANWQSQCGALLHAGTQRASLRDATRAYVFGLHDEILRMGFYDRIARQPLSQATVEVACGLEGLNDAYTIAARARHTDRVRAYGDGIRAALRWLCRAQRLDHCTTRERGGFGHSLNDRTQRIDVTGHVLGGFLKAVWNGLSA
jgi:hypothetical protein